MDPILAELIAHLLRTGRLDVADLNEMAARLEREGMADEAHGVRCCLADALAPSPDEQAEARRAGFTVHSGGNGGE